MIRWRVGLAQFLAIVAVLAVGMAVMKIANGVADRVAVLGSSVALLVGTVGAMVRRRRSAWVGFALFGWAYFAVLLAVPLLALLGPPFSSEIPLIWPIFEVEDLAASLHPLPTRPTYPLPYSVTLDDSGHAIRAGEGPEAGLPLSSGDLRLWEAYQAQAIPYQQKAGAFFHSIRIALAFQGLAFAMLGAAVGQALSDRPTTIGDSPGAPTPEMPG